MKYLKLFENLDAANNYEADTPFVSIVDGVDNKVLFVPDSVGETVTIKTDGEGFIKYEAKPTGPANNEIWYTSTDGNIVTPSSPRLGANIISNTYEKNGKGVIACDGDITSFMGGRRGLFISCANLKSIILPNSITDILCTTLFYNCNNLTSLVLPSALKTISTGVVGTQQQPMFWNCPNLTSIILPDGLKELGHGVFYDSSIREIEIPNSVTSIGNYAFDTCRSLTSITIPNSVTSIGSGAFYNCTSLTSIEIPNSVTSIGGSAFGGCTSLTSITISNSVTSIGDYAFESCTSLTSITMPNSVASIGWGAFNGCTSLTSITIEATIPPAIYWNLIPDDVTAIYVPTESIEAYKTASNWSTFASNIQAIS